MPKKSRKNQRTHDKTQIQPPRRRLLVRIIIFTAILVVILATIGLGGWRFYDSRIKPYNQTAIKVNNTTFNLRYFVNMLGNNYGSVTTDAVSAFSAYGDSTIQQFAGYTEQLIINNEIIKQGSKALGFQIDRKIVEGKLRDSGTTVSKEQIDSRITQDLIKAQIPDNQPQAKLQIMLFGSESAAQAANARVKAGESFAAVADEVSFFSSSGSSKSELEWMTAREIDLTTGSASLGNIALGTNIGNLSNPIYDDRVSKQYGYWVVKVTDKENPTSTEPAKIHLYGILVGTEQAAQDIISKLTGGADWNDLARQSSQDPEANINGADLGWVTTNQDPGEFDNLFNISLNTLYGPVGDPQAQTKGGYWVFNVVEKNDQRTLTSDQQTLLQDDFLSRCTAELQKNPDFKVERLLNQKMVDFALNEVVLSQVKGGVIISTISLPDAEAGVSYYFQVVVYGNQRGNVWSITEGSLPDGLVLDENTGVISGVPVYAGGTGFTLRVSSNLHYWEQELFIRLHIPVEVTSVSLPYGQVGTDYFTNLEFFGDTDFYAWSIVSGSLPDGLKLDAGTGSISGKPTAVGIYNFTVQVDDGFNKATKALSLEVK
jgi:parvulin-like peptidyl-prolyl isomerase